MVMVVLVISYFGSRNIDFTPGPAYPSSFFKFGFVFFFTADNKNPFPMGIAPFPSSHELPTACVGERSFTVRKTLFPHPFIRCSVLVVHSPEAVLFSSVVFTLESVAAGVSHEHLAFHAAAAPLTFVTIAVGVDIDTFAMVVVLFPFTFVA